MQTLLIIVSVVLLVGVGVLLYILFQLRQELSQEKAPDKSLLLMQQQMATLQKVLDERMHQTHRSMTDAQQYIHKTIQEQFQENTKLIHGISNQSNKVITQITEKLANLDKTNQQVVGFSEQLNNLEKILKSQKQRGNLGEAGLQLVLENILPPTAFSLQHTFDDGDTVDAAIFTKDGIIPVDSKFPLENYDRLIHETDDGIRKKLETEFKNDLKKRIDETSKYIKPKQGTLDFAFMFIPAEAIYYDLLVNEVGAVKVNTRSLIEYAFRDKKVIIVSPTTFAAYLQTVLQGLRSLQIEESAKVIRKNVMMLQKHMKAYELFMKKLGGTLGTTVNHFNAAYKELGKIDKDVVRITEGERAITPETLQKPTLDDNIE